MCTPIYIYIFSLIRFYHLLACAMCFERHILCFTQHHLCGYPRKAMSDSCGCSALHDIFPSPSFYGTKFMFTFCYRKTQHIYLTTRWDLVPIFTRKKRMENLQLHTEINMFCTGVFLNTKDCEKELFSVNMVYITLNWIWNDNNFKVLDVKDLQ